MKQTFAILFFFPSLMWAQLTTNSSLSPRELVEEILAGPGIEISNVKYKGAKNAIGRFNAERSNVGIDKGLILSTGTVLDRVNSFGLKIGPVGPNNNREAETEWLTPGDPDLTAIAGVSTNDAAVLEFDFIPKGEKIEFNYVFASEEYLRYVDGVYVDVFAFFISGPGIVGVENLAVIPETGEEITINTVNNVSNSAYYIDNCSSAIRTCSEYRDATVTNFNGFTVPLKAVSKVIPCKKYHLKIAIADGYDERVDSGVFLEGGSLKSNPLYKTEMSSTIDVGIKDLIPEGCSDGILKITREENIDEEFSIDYRVLGDAENRVDYNELLEIVNFAIGQKETEINIVPISDGLTEIDENVILRFPNPDVCITDSVNFEFVISDEKEITSKPDLTNVICSKDYVNIEVNFEGGYGPYSYSWETGSETASINVNPEFSTSYDFEVEDVCGSKTTNEYFVEVPIYDPLHLVMPRDTEITCAGEDLYFLPIVSDGAGNYEYKWDEGQSTIGIETQVLGSKEYSFKVEDQCGETIEGSVYVTLNYPKFSAEAFSDTIVCPGDSVFFHAKGIGGIGPYNYVWEDLSTDSFISLSAAVSQVINVSIYDSCGIIPAKDSIKLIVQKPAAKFTSSERLMVSEQVNFYSTSLGDIVDYNWDLGNGEVSSEKNPFTFYEEDLIYEVSLIVTDELGCKDSLKKELKLEFPLYVWAPNAFTPGNQDGVNDYFEVKCYGVSEFEMWIFNRWGEQVFYADDYYQTWDGRDKSSGELLPIDAYVYKIIGKGENGEDFEKMGSVSLIR